MEGFLESLPKIVVCVAVIYSITLHELAHAVTAYWFGDRTAKDLGRITINPIPSIDPLGSILVPALLIYLDTGLFFGWAKPVPVVPDNFKHRFWGEVVVSMAGIVVNLTLAFLLILVCALTRAQVTAGQTHVLVEIARWNVLLGLFNLLPIPPLDGHHVFKYLLPGAVRRAYLRVGFLGIAIVVLLFFYTPLGRWMASAREDVLGVMREIGLTIARLLGVR